MLPSFLERIPLSCQIGLDVVLDSLLSLLGSIPLFNFARHFLDLSNTLPNVRGFTSLYCQVVLDLTHYSAQTYCFSNCLGLLQTFCQQFGLISLVCHNMLSDLSPYCAPILLGLSPIAPFQQGLWSRPRQVHHERGSTGRGFLKRENRQEEPYFFGSWYSFSILSCSSLGQSERGFWAMPDCESHKPSAV